MDFSPDDVLFVGDARNKNVSARGHGFTAAACRGDPKVSQPRARGSAGTSRITDWRSGRHRGKVVSRTITLSTRSGLELPIAAIRSMVDTFMAAFGRVDILVNNAGSPDAPTSWT